MIRKPKYIEPAWQIGALQGTAVIAYVILLVTLMNALGNIENGPNQSLFIPIFFLLTFVISALICSSLVLGYPAVVALNGDIKRAIMVVVWTGVTMMVGAVVALLALSIQYL